ncbi:hypothetical protein VKT23_005260 [Stygiomarasmius scandens]|uniref:Uncharacterized protein n=1 Tax=Marasmiellus scandens TaxID=2682957 RepID=A0ABR1JQF1_9AGAR
MVVWIGLINLGVALVWIPAQLQINAKYMEVNSMVALLLPNTPSVNLNSNNLVVLFDRLEKSLYLVTDAALNYYFIYVVQRRLVASGLKKYDKLVSFNKMIIWVSLAMDVMIIAMMSLKNAFLYTIFHPLAYMVKLEIEMTMSNLIVAVAVGTGVVVDVSLLNHAPDLLRVLN